VCPTIDVQYIDPKESGAVIPILHVNGYKIGERTIPGTMDNLEIACLYTGYGYQVRIVEYGATPSTEEHDVAINYDMAASMEWALQEIRKIQHAARSGNPIVKPRWPIIIMRTPKGWSGPVKSGENPIEGSWRAHQVPLPNAVSNEKEFDLLIKWLESYHPKELFDTEVDSSHPGSRDAVFKAASFIKDSALRIIPRDTSKRMGMVEETFRGFKPLKTPEWKDFGHEQGKEVSNMKA
jgi:xylulose-5-phosphate/fructose-6-phosphate phosphoketolase